MEITTTLTPVYIGTQRMLLTPNTSVAGGTSRAELGRAAQFQGVKNVLVPLFVNVSKQQTPGWEGGAVLCVVPAAVLEEERHTRSSSRESASSEPPGSSPSPRQVLRDPQCPHPL